jgi:hypothetical protein
MVATLTKVIAREINLMPTLTEFFAKETDFIGGETEMMGTSIDPIATLPKIRGTVIDFRPPDPSHIARFSSDRSAIRSNRSRVRSD